MKRKERCSVHWKPESFRTLPIISSYTSCRRVLKVKEYVRCALCIFGVSVQGQMSQSTRYARRRRRRNLLFLYFLYVLLLTLILLLFLFIIIVRLFFLLSICGLCNADFKHYFPLNSTEAGKKIKFFGNVRSVPFERCVFYRALNINFITTSEIIRSIFFFFFKVQPIFL